MKLKYIQIETTTYCNANCWFCASPKIPSIHMKEEIFKKIIDDTRGLGITYRPFGLGEPLLNKMLLDYLPYIKQDVTAKIEIHTNGEVLTKKIEDKIAPYIDTIRFSIDGIREKTFAKNRQLNLKKTYNNTKRFILNNPDMNIEVRMINLPDTKREQHFFVKYWNHIKSNCAKITELYNDPWTIQSEAKMQPCKKVQEEMFIGVDGNVKLCPWDNNNKSFLGNVKDKNITEIWNEYQYKKIRKTLKAGKRNCIELCSRCDAVFK